MDYLDLTIKKKKRTESASCAISGKPFGKEAVLTVLVPKKHLALSVGSINVDSVEDKNNGLTYKIHDNIDEEVRFCEQVQSNNLSSTIDNTHKKGSKSSKVSSCEQTASYALSSTVKNTDKR